MAERINWNNISPTDPRFYEADPNNPNTNISASKYDPTDPTSKGNPAGEKYNEFLRTANIGDTFDWGNGTQSKFTGFNKAGTPMIQTVESNARQDWRGTMSGATSFADAVNKLKAAGFDPQMAQYLVTQSGTEFPDQGKYLAGTQKTFFSQIGAMADGTPIYGYDSKGKPVTSPTGAIYSTTSAADAIKNFTSGASPLSTGSSSSPLTTQDTLDTKKAERVSAYNLLYNEFNKYGLGTLVSDIKNYLIDNTFDPSEFSIQLQNTPAYQKRFAANADRIKAGLSALRPAEYIALEDQYQNLMRNYGLPESYYSKGDLGMQEGFNKLIASDVSPTELEDRIATAQNRVVNADPNVLKMLKSYYPDITNGEILAYTLDPKNALDMIKRKVTAAEIGGVQYGAGLNAGLPTAEALAKAGVTSAQYAQATPFISQAAERGSQLADIYGQTPYDQAAAEAEAFNLSGGAQAAQKRKKLSALEQAQFGGSSGVGALGRDKALYGSMQGQAGSF